MTGFEKVLKELLEVVKYDEYDNATYMFPESGKCGCGQMICRSRIGAKEGSARPDLLPIYNRRKCMYCLKFASYDPNYWYTYIDKGTAKAVMDRTSGESKPRTLMNYYNFDIISPNPSIQMI